MVSVKSGGSMMMLRRAFISSSVHRSSGGNSNQPYEKRSSTRVLQSLEQAIENSSAVLDGSDFSSR